MKNLLAFLIIIPLTTFSLISDTIAKKKFAVGISFSPDYAYRTLKTDASSQWIADNRNDTEIPKFGYTTGLNFSMTLGKRFSVEIGALYSDKGEKTKKINLVWGTPDPDAPTKVKFIHHYYYLDIPLKVNFHFFKIRKNGFFVSAGISSNIFITEKTTTIADYSDGHTSTNTRFDQDELKKLNFAFTAGIGYQNHLSNKLLLNVQPTYRRSITPVNHIVYDGWIRSYLYSLGLDIGLYYKF